MRSEIAQKKVWDWPTTDEAYLTLDLECDFGTALSSNSYQAASNTAPLVDFLERLDIPLTVFVQTELLTVAPAAIDRLRAADIRTRFYPHSHTHQKRNQTDVGFEVRESTTRYREFFGRNPTGYRFPDGAVHAADYHELANHGYQFDASVFPMMRPDRFNNSGEPTVPSYQAGPDIVEIPFTMYSNKIRVPTALSYCRLIGRPYTELLRRRPPSVVMCNFHMHDVVTPPAYRHLPRLYKAVYARNGGRGYEFLERIITGLRDAGLSFETLDSVHERLRNHHSTRG